MTVAAKPTKKTNDAGVTSGDKAREAAARALEKADRARLAALATSLGVPRTALTLDGDDVVLRLSRRQADRLG